MIKLKKKLKENTNNVNNMYGMFDYCYSLKKSKIVFNKKDNKLLNKINEDVKKE